MAETKSVRGELVDFKNKRDKWLEQDKIMVEKRNKLKTLDADWTMLVWRFNKAFTQPMDEAWARLTQAEKGQF